MDDALIEQLADEAHAGYDVDKVIAGRGKPGRPTLGSASSTIKSVRLDPELKERLTQRAQADGVAVSEVIREALRQHLAAS
ncbi:MAG: CopG family transcriptional regulator [Aquihabitans sp.]